MFKYLKELENSLQSIKGLISASNFSSADSSFKEIESFIQLLNDRYEYVIITLHLILNQSQKVDIPSLIEKCAADYTEANIETCLAKPVQTLFKNIDFTAIGQLTEFFYKLKRIDKKFKASVEADILSVGNGKAEYSKMATKLMRSLISAHAQERAYGDKFNEFLLSLSDILSPLKSRDMNNLIEQKRVALHSCGFEKIDALNEVLNVLQIANKKYVIKQGYENINENSINSFDFLSGFLKKLRTAQETVIMLLNIFHIDREQWHHVIDKFLNEYVGDDFEKATKQFTPLFLSIAPAGLRQLQVFCLDVQEIKAIIKTEINKMQDDAVNRAYQLLIESKINTLIITNEELSELKKLSFFSQKLAKNIPTDETIDLTGNDDPESITVNSFSEDIEIVGTENTDDSPQSNGSNLSNEEKSLVTGINNALNSSSSDLNTEVATSAPYCNMEEINSRKELGQNKLPINPNEYMKTRLTPKVVGVVGVNENRKNKVLVENGANRRPNSFASSAKKKYYTQSVNGLIFSSNNPLILFTLTSVLTAANKDILNYLLRVDLPQSEDDFLIKNIRITLLKFKSRIGALRNCKDNEYIDHLFFGSCVPDGNIGEKNIEKFLLVINHLFAVSSTLTRTNEHEVISIRTLFVFKLIFQFKSDLQGSVNLIGKTLLIIARIMNFKPAADAETFDNLVEYIQNIPHQQRQEINKLAPKKWKETGDLLLAINDPAPPWWLESRRGLQNNNNSNEDNTVKVISNSYMLDKQNNSSVTLSNNSESLRKIDPISNNNNSATPVTREILSDNFFVFNKKSKDRERPKAQASLINIHTNSSRFFSLPMAPTLEKNDQVWSDFLTCLLNDLLIKTISNKSFSISAGNRSMNKIMDFIQQAKPIILKFPAAVQEIEKEAKAIDAITIEKLIKVANFILWKQQGVDKKNAEMLPYFEKLFLFKLIFEFGENLQGWTIAIEESLCYLATKLIPDIMAGKDFSHLIKAVESTNSQPNLLVQSGNLQHSVDGVQTLPLADTTPINNGEKNNGPSLWRK